MLMGYKMQLKEISSQEISSESEEESDSSISILSPLLTNKKTNTFKSYITDSNNRKSEQNIIKFFDTHNDDLSFVSEADNEIVEIMKNKSKKKIKKKLKFLQNSTSKKKEELSHPFPLLKSFSARKKSCCQFEFNE